MVTDCRVTPVMCARSACVTSMSPSASDAAAVAPAVTRAAAHGEQCLDGEAGELDGQVGEAEHQPGEVVGGVGAHQADLLDAAAFEHEAVEEVVRIAESALQRPEVERGQFGAMENPGLITYALPLILEAVLLLCFVPQISTWLPDLVMGPDGGR